MVENGAGVGVVSGDRLVSFEEVAAVGAGLVVGEDGAGGFGFVIDLGHRDDVAVACEHRGGAADGGCDLKNFGVEDDPRVASGCSGADDVGSHGPGGGAQGDVLVVD